MDLLLGSARDLAAHIRERRISSREALDGYIRRIERFNGPLNAVVTLDAERARRRAAAADEALARGDIWGPLHGVPMTIKDTLETAELRTTAGSKDLEQHVPVDNAVAVQRLADAGAVVFGKTNTPLMAGDLQTFNEVFGTTNNPWDPERSPGGSSGGAAVAVACGLTALEYGSDIGGSIRTPCHWCGIYGHKSTYGIVPLRGHIPGPPGTLSETDLGVVGPMARSADDLELALGVTAGPSLDRAVAWRLDLPPPRCESLRQYRVAAWLDDPAFPVDAEVSTVLHATVDALRSAGVTVDDRARPALNLREVYETYFRLVMPVLIAGLPEAAFAALTEMARGASPDDQSAMATIARDGTETHRRWLSADEQRARHRKILGEFFARYDVLLCPVNPVVAVPHDHREPAAQRTIGVNGEERNYYDLLGWISLATSTWYPATVAPVGRSRSGLPVGVQVVGPYLEDRTTIDFARRLGEVVGGFEAPPAFR